MKMGDYLVSKEPAYCKMCLKHTHTAEIKFEDITINICDSCLDNIKEIF